MEEFIANNGEELKLTQPENQGITFHANNETREPLLELKMNGDILVKGKVIENDKQVVDALREFISQWRNE